MHGDIAQQIFNECQSARVADQAGLGWGWKKAAFGVLA